MSSNTIETKVYDYRDSSPYLFNDDYVEFGEVNTGLRDLVASNVTLGATFRNSRNANYGKGILVPYTKGNIVMQDSKLAMLSSQSETYIKFETANNLNKNKFGLIFTWYPNYSGNPAITQTLFSINNGIDNKNAIELFHTSTSEIVLNIYDKDGNILITTRQDFLIELANTANIVYFDFNTNSSELENRKLDINCKVGSTSILSYSEDWEDKLEVDTLSNICFGADVSGEFNRPNFQLNKLQIVDTAPNVIPTEYTMPETRYTTNPQKIYPEQYLTIEDIISANYLTTEDTNFYVAYTFEVNGIEYYYDMTQLKWSEHLEDTDLTKDLSRMVANVDSLISSGVQFRLIPYLVSIRGDQTPYITAGVLVYDEYVQPTTLIPKALVYGYVVDSLGRPLRGARVRITPSKFSVTGQGSNLLLGEITSTIVTNNSGYWDANIILSNAFSPLVTYNFEISYRGDVIYTKSNISITTEGTIKYEDL